MLLLALVGCSQDPTLYGYWDVIRWQVGEGADAEEKLDVGHIEFTADSKAWLLLSYRYEVGQGFVPDPTPNAEELEVSIEHQNEDEDQFFPSYKSKNERYFLEFNGRYEILDWTGGGMRLSAKEAAPYGTWEDVGITEMGNYAPTTKLPVEMELVR